MTRLSLLHIPLTIFCLSLKSVHLASDVDDIRVTVCIIVFRKMDNAKTISQFHVLTLGTFLGLRDCNIEVVLYFS